MPTRRAVAGGMAAGAVLFAARPTRAEVEVNVVSLGGDPTGVRNSTDAFQAAARAIEQAGGGQLVIPPGRYRVGRQGFAGAVGKGHAFLGEDIVAIRHCPSLVTIEADGATLAMTEGLRFGSFDPVGGTAFSPKAGAFYDPDHAASLGSFFNFEDNAEIVLTGLLTLDGAIERQTVGGRWGDVGRQLAASGVRAYNNRAFTLKGLRSRGQGLDDLMIGWDGLTLGHPAYPHVLEDVQGVGAGRNGLSWVGGNALEVSDCRFERAGGRGGTVSSPPGAGIDIEAENAICRNGVFRRVECVDNAGCGLVADSGDGADCRFEDCRFVGVANWSAWLGKPRLSFERCVFVGPIVDLYGMAGPPADAVQFVDCVNTLDPKRSPTGAVYPHVSDFTSGKGALWQGGEIDLAGMPGFNAAGGADGMRWKDTRIVGTSAGALYAKGRFEGRVEIDYPNGVWDPAGGAVIEGTLTARAKMPGGVASKISIFKGPMKR